MIACKQFDFDQGSFMKGYFKDHCLSSCYNGLCLARSKTFIQTAKRQPVLKSEEKSFPVPKPPITASK
jgi:hypothetical protein